MVPTNFYHPAVAKQQPQMFNVTEISFESTKDKSNPSNRNHVTGDALQTAKPNCLTHYQQSGPLKGLAEICEGLAVDVTRDGVYCGRARITRVTEW